jgi:uncharacterized Zn-binding protein involved in type VI secretion
MSMAAKLGDRVVAVDIHIVMIPSPAGPIATPVPSPFVGQLVESLCSTVMIDNMPVATVGSVALNTAPHVPAGGPFQKPPSNRSTVKMGSETVFAGGKKIARLGDIVETCNDPQDAPQGCIIANCTVKVG